MINENLNAAGLRPEIYQKIKEQANYLGLQNKYTGGEKINIMLDDKVYEVEFSLEEARVMNRPPSCSGGNSFIKQHAVKDVEDGCKKLAELLKLDKPVAERVFFAVVQDDTYFHNLKATVNTPAFLKQLLNNPPVIESKVDHNAPEGKQAKKSTKELITKVSKSMIDWSKTGFKKVDDLTYERRISACMNCKFLKDPPDTLAYKFATLTKKQKLDKKICGMCGCLVANKARLPHEFCPSKHDQLEGMTKWGEPIRGDE